MVRAVVDPVVHTIVVITAIFAAIAMGAGLIVLFTVASIISEIIDDVKEKQDEN